MASHAAFDPQAWPRRLNLGCGWDVRPGYLNVDFLEVHGPDLVADIRDLSMLPSGHYEEVVAQDVLEHLPRRDAPAALREWSRLLVPGGRLELRVPNLLGLAYLFTQKRSLAEQEELVMCTFGTQGYDGDFHLNGYTELVLRSHLRDAGFGTAELRPFHEWLFDVVAVKGEVTGTIEFDDCPYMTLEPPSVVAERIAAPAPDEPRPASRSLPRRVLARVRRQIAVLRPSQ